MVKHWFGIVLEFRDDALCQNFAELNASSTMAA
jgi:hypothetical protein